MTPHPLLDYSTDESRRELADILGERGSVSWIRQLRYKLTVDGYAPADHTGAVTSGADGPARRCRRRARDRDHRRHRPLAARPGCRRGVAPAPHARSRRRVRPEAIAPFAFTQGDELQGLLAPGRRSAARGADRRAGRGTPADALGRRGRARSRPGRVGRPSGRARRSTPARALIEATARTRDGLAMRSGDDRADGLLADLAPLLAELLDDLTARQREVARLALVEHLRQADVAERLDVSRASVSVTWGRGRIRSIDRLVARAPDDLPGRRGGGRRPDRDRRAGPAARVARPRAPRRGLHPPDRLGRIRQGGARAARRCAASRSTWRRCSSACCRSSSRSGCPASSRRSRSRRRTRSIDRAKIVLTRRAEAHAIREARAAHEEPPPAASLGTAWTPMPAALFALDQLAHVIVIVFVWLTWLVSAPLAEPFGSTVTSMLGALGSCARPPCRAGGGRGHVARDREHPGRIVLRRDARPSARGPHGRGGAARGARARPTTPARGRRAVRGTSGSVRCASRRRVASSPRRAPRPRRFPLRPASLPGRRRRPGSGRRSGSSSAC